MSRSLWFVAGAGAGVYAVARVRRATEALTADGLRDRARGIAVGARLFGEEVRAGREEAEHDLRQRLGLAPTGRPELVVTPAGSRRVLRAPTEKTDHDPKDS